MKKQIITWGLMFAATLALSVSCAKEQDILVKGDESMETVGVPFELFAGVDTKTSTADGTTFTWSDKDSLNVFHAVATTSEYGSNDKFDLSSGNTFTGTLKDGELTAAAYDWYVLYPYSKFFSTPANTTAYLSIGSSGKTVAQKQAGYNSKLHLAGKYFPLYGKAENVAADTKPSLALKQALAVIKVHVTNKNTSSLTVGSVSITAPEEIVGSYIINFAGETPTFTKSSDDYVSNTANLTVSGGTALTKDAAADFYIAIKPFKQVAAATLTVSVNGYEKEVAIPAGTEFKPGKIKTVNFEYDYVSGTPEPISKTGYYRVENAAWLTEGDRVVIVANDSNKGLSSVQNDNNRPSINVTKVADGIYSKLTAYSGIQEFVIEDGTKSETFGFWCDNGVQANKYIYAASSSANQLKSQVSLDDNASFAISVDGSGNATVTAQGTNSRNLLRYNESSSLFACYGSGQKQIAIYKYYGGITPTCTTPTISLVENKVNIIADDGATIYYTIDGTDPTNESTKYTAPFEIVGSTTVKAIAIRKHYNNSSTASEVLSPVTPDCATPVITGKGSSFVISCATDGATIYYETSTTDMSSVATPTTSSSVYSNAVSITSTTYVKAYAVKAGYNDSAIASATCEYAITAIIYFNNTSSGTAINNSSVTGNDSQGNSWTVTTAGTTSFTSNSAYYQVGSSSKPATSITFTTTLGETKRIIAMSAKFGGFSGTAGTVSLKVGDTTIGTGALNASNDVTVEATDTTQSGTNLTVTVTGIAKGVKVYYISVSYE